MSDAMLKLKQQMATTWANNDSVTPAAGESMAALPSSLDAEAKMDEAKVATSKGVGRPLPVEDGVGSSGGEVARLAKQLSVQTEYTNKLLLQLQALEEQSLKNHREMQGREATLRRTMEAMDQSRSDTKMLRTRLQNANDVIEKIRREQHDALVATHDRDREMARMEKLVDDQAHELDRVTGEARSFAEEVRRLKQAYNDAQDALEDAKSTQKEERVGFQNVYDPVGECGCSFNPLLCLIFAYFLPDLLMNSC